MPRYELFEAIQRDDLDSFRELIRSCSDINTLSPDLRCTLLQYAIHYEREQMVLLLINRGSDVELSGFVDSSFSPLTRAVYSGLTEIAKILIEAGANVNCQDDEGFTPLHFAAANGDTELIHCLLEAKAIGSVKTKLGATPAYHAVMAGHLAVLLQLEHYGWVSDWGELFDSAIFDEQFEIAEAIIKKGYRPNASALTEHINVAYSKGRLDTVTFIEKLQTLGADHTSDEMPTRRAINREVQMFVWQRDEGKCVNCGSNENLEFDHIIPVSKGGANTARNLQLLCEACNRAKSANIGG